MYRLLTLLLGVLAATAAHADESWQGAYIGLSGGRFESDSKWTTTQMGFQDPTTICAPAVAPACFSSPEATVGAQGPYAAGHAGYNWAVGRWFLLGLEAGAGYTNAKSNTIPYTPGWFDQDQDDRLSAKYGWNASLVGRAGFTAGPVLLYGVAGPSWQKVTIDYQCLGNGTGTNSFCSTPQAESRSDVRFGWIAGGGLEVRLATHWTTRIDYRYAQYETKDYTFFSDSPNGEVVFARTTLKTTLFTLGVSYRF